MLSYSESSSPNSKFDFNNEFSRLIIYFNEDFLGLYLNIAFFSRAFTIILSLSIWIVKGDWITSSKPAKIALFSVFLSINAEQATKTGQNFASIDDYFLKNELFWS